MRKLFTILVATTIFLSCKSEAKKDDDKSKEEVKKSTAAFSVANAKNDINFTAYKTTEKVAVGGEFTEINITSGGEGNTIKEAMNGAVFSIPINSLATKDTSRDYKIQKFFFGVMTNTKTLTGYLTIKDDTNGVAKLTMNNETKDVPFTYTIKGNTFNMQATIDINTWNAGAALASLNKICEVLHAGADGVSKTWSDVALNITSTF
ncbi:MAG: YceI family protein [Flavobacteriaceae bacterium]|nr:YceI family protein [Flavobacteriaceae bacterium]